MRWKIHILYLKFKILNQFVLFLIYRTLSVLLFYFDVERSKVFWIKSVKKYVKRKILFNNQFDRVLINLIERYSNEYINKIDYRNCNLKEQTTNKINLLFVYSTIYNTGGHTRIILDLITSINKEKYNIYIYSDEFLNPSTNCIHYSEIVKYSKKQRLYDQDNSYNGLNTDILDFIKDNKIKHIISFEHSEDVYLKTAINIISKLKISNVIYYDHNNFSPFTIPKNIDKFITITDYLKIKAESYYNNVKLLRISQECSDVSYDNTYKLKGNSIVFLTITTYKRIIHNADNSFANFIKGVLSKYVNSKYILVSPKRNKYFKLLEYYFREEIKNSQVEFLYNITDLKQLYNKYDIYVDSIPVGGGKTFLEMVTFGKPCIMMEKINNMYRNSDILNYNKVYDFNMFCERVQKLRDNKAYCKEYVDESFNIVHQYFSKEVIAEEFENILEEN